MPKYKHGWIPKEQRSVLKCKDCKQEKPRSEFHPHGTSTTGLQQYGSRCKVCENIHGAANWGCRAHSKEKIALIESAKTECVKCGYSKCTAALDFHHIDDSTKSFDVASSRRNKSIDVNEVRKEIKKCVVLCSNCHREYHAGMWAIEEVL